MPPKRKAYLPPKAQERIARNSQGGSASPSQSAARSSSSDDDNSAAASLSPNPTNKAASPTATTTTTTTTKTPSSQRGGTPVSSAPFLPISSGVTCKVLVPLDSRVPPQQARLPISLMRKLACLPGTLLEILSPATRKGGRDSSANNTRSNSSGDLLLCVLEAQPSAGDVTGLSIALCQSTADVTLHGAKEVVLRKMMTASSSSFSSPQHHHHRFLSALTLIYIPTNSSGSTSSNNNNPSNSQLPLQEGPCSAQIASQFRYLFHSCPVYSGMFLELEWVSKKYTFQVCDLVAAVAPVVSGKNEKGVSGSDGGGRGDDDKGGASLSFGYVHAGTCVTVRKEKEEDDTSVNEDTDDEMKEATTTATATTSTAAAKGEQDEGGKNIDNDDDDTKEMKNEWLRSLYHAQPWAQQLSSILPLPNPILSPPQQQASASSMKGAGGIHRHHWQLYHILFHGESGIGKTFTLEFLNTCLTTFSIINQEENYCGGAKKEEEDDNGNSSHAPSVVPSCTSWTCMTLRLYELILACRSGDQEEEEGGIGIGGGGDGPLDIVRAFKDIVMNRIINSSSSSSAKKMKNGKHHVTAVFLDDFHLLCGAGGGGGSSNSNSTISVSTWADERAHLELSALMDTCLHQHNIIFIASVPSTNRLPSYLLRSGRFSLQISLEAPNSVQQRYLVLLMMMFRRKQENGGSLQFQEDDEDDDQKNQQKESANSPSEKPSRNSIESLPTVPPQLISHRHQLLLYNMAKQTHGYIPKDLDDIFRWASNIAFQRSGGFSGAAAVVASMLQNKKIAKRKGNAGAAAGGRLLSSCTVTDEDLLSAIRRVRPSAIKSFEITIPHITWNDIGGSGEAKRVLQDCLEWCRGDSQKRALFDYFGLSPPRGVLLFGPPGCSKTLLAKALAHESEMNFISIKGPEVFSKWVGDSEKAIRDLFKKARQASPCIIFIDELDGMCGHRGKGGGVSDRVISQFLTELDGLPSTNTTGGGASGGKQQQVHAIMLVAATNRPENIDPAVLRPGRIDRKLYIGLPDEQERLAIAKIGLKKLPFESSEVKTKALELIAATSTGYTGAEIVAVCKEAGFLAIGEDVKATQVEMRHVEAALQLVKPQVSEKDVAWYKQWSAGGSATSTSAPTASSSTIGTTTSASIHRSLHIDPIPPIVPGGFGNGPWAQFLQQPVPNTTTASNAPPEGQ